MADDSQALEPLRCCPVCQGEDVRPFFTLDGVPVHCNVHYTDQSDALTVTRGDIQLAFCHTCGHIFNQRFDPELMGYEGAYENSLHYSPQFQRYAESLADDLIARYNLNDKMIVDVGCGRGDFLRLICARGKNRGVGFDPTYVSEGQDDDESLTFIRDYYSEKYSEYSADLLLCRHVLEHIETPVDFLKAIRRSIKPEDHTAIFFEVPNAIYTIRDLGIWDIIYEHCSYFTLNSLLEVFQASGYRPTLAAPTFGDQFLTIEAERSDEPLVNKPPAPLDLTKVEALIDAFDASYTQKVARWKAALSDYAAQGKRVVIWGGGSKGVSFLNALQTRGVISYVVDINPRKHGMFVAGTGQQIVSPDFLPDYQPDVVLVMNPLYVDEIRQQLRQRGLTPEMQVV